MEEIKFESPMTPENDSTAKPVDRYFSPILIIGAAASMFIPLIGILCAICSLPIIFRDNDDEHRKLNLVSNLIYAGLLFVCAVTLQVLVVIASKNDPDASSSLIKYLFTF